MIKVRLKGSDSNKFKLKRSVVYNAEEAGSAHYVIGNNTYHRKHFDVVEDKPKQDEPKPLTLVTDLGNKECIHCPTEAEAEAICKLMHEAGLKWANGDSYKESTEWSRFNTRTCYIPKKGTFDITSDLINSGYLIYPASDFLPSDFHEPQPIQTETVSVKDFNLSRMKPFPNGYFIPVGTRCVTLEDWEGSEFKTPKGTEVYTVEQDTLVVKTRRCDGVHNPVKRESDGVYFVHELAPVSPSENPLHKDFGKRQGWNNSDKLQEEIDQLKAELAESKLNTIDQMQQFDSDLTVLIRFVNSNRSRWSNEQLIALSEAIGTVALNQK